MNISDARARLPKMIRESVMGRTYLIGSARNADAPSAVLIGVSKLDEVVQEVAQSGSSRTLGDILDSLPFSGMELRSPLVEPLPGAGLPTLRLPKCKRLGAAP